MRLWSDSFSEGGVLPPECAFARIDPARHTVVSNNRNPHLAWDEVPAAAHSLALFCRDVDAPATAEGVNQAGAVVPITRARRDFYHWILVDIPLELHQVVEGQFSDMVTPHGKPGPVAPIAVRNGTEHVLRQGLNDYTGWLASDPAMAGDYFGYDGPAPPWNDERAHAYVFTLYALDVARFPLEGRFTGIDARQALRGHLLDEAQIYCVYSLNPDLAAKL